MKIHGIQKLTLIDYPGKTAATLFFNGCNLKCPFCHNAVLIDNEGESDGMGEDEALSFLQTRKNKLDGVCISGGEPLMQIGIENFIEKIKKLGFLVKLDTNGTVYEKLKLLTENKLIDYVAMDIKNSIKNYGKTVGMENFNTSEVEKSADFLMNSDLPYEFRTTVTRELHSAEDFHLIGKRFENAEQYFLQQFVNSSGVTIKNLSANLSAYGKEEMLEFINILSQYIPSATLRGV